MGKRILVAVIFVPLIFVVLYGVAPSWPVVLPIAVFTAALSPASLWAARQVSRRFTLPE